MSEYPFGKPDVSEYNWADGSTPYGVSAAPAGRREDGYNYGAVPTHEHVNYRWNKDQELSDYLLSLVPRRFGDAYDAISDMRSDPGYLFRVSSARLEWQSIFDDAVGAHAIEAMTSDGQMLFLVSGDTVRAFGLSNLSGGALWEAQLIPGRDIVSIFCDGFHLFLCYDNIAGTHSSHVHVINPVNRAAIDDFTVGGTSDSFRDISSNGHYAYILLDDSSRVYRYAIDTEVLTYMGLQIGGHTPAELYKVTACPGTAVGLSVFNVDTDGFAHTGVYSGVWTNAGAANLDWSYQWTVPEAEGLTNDGKFIYARNIGFGSTAGHVRCFAIFGDGTTVWEQDTVTSATSFHGFEGLDVDGKYLYISTSEGATGKVVVLDKVTGAVLRHDVSIRGVSCACDRLVTMSAPASYEVLVLSVGVTANIFEIAVKEYAAIPHKVWQPHY